MTVTKKVTECLVDDDVPTASTPDVLLNGPMSNTNASSSLPDNTVGAARFLRLRSCVATHVTFEVSSTDILLSIISSDILEVSHVSEYRLQMEVVQNRTAQFTHASSY